MNFGVTGSRPPSTRRPQSGRNPITGVEIGYTAQNSARQKAPPILDEDTYNYRPESGLRSRPDGVPLLNLAAVVGKDDDKGPIPVQLDPYNYQFNSPGSASAVSWGTPSSASQRKRFTDFSIATQVSDRNPEPPSPVHKQKPKQPTVWDVPPCPENLRPPSAQYKQKYKEYEQDMRNAYRSKGVVSERDIEDKIAALKIDLGDGDPGDDVDDPRDQLQKEWTGNPYSHAHTLRRMDVEELAMIKKKNKLIETVMMDQLSRGVLSDPEQDTCRLGEAAHHTPGMPRGAVRTLHNTKVATSGMATENMLSRRVRFDARILSRNGRDAVRELMGFYFDMDNSITIYEYKMFGKTAKALPYINRGRYRHLRGRSKDSLYHIGDIAVGETLHFYTDGQPLPNSIKAHPTVAFRITTIDSSTKMELLNEGTHGHQRNQLQERLNRPETPEDGEDRALRNKIQGVVGKQLQNRGVKVLTGLGRLLRARDASGDGRLNKYELEKALVDFHVDVEQYLFDDLWAILDPENSGYLEYGEFMRNFIGEMAENRKELVRKAFTKVDTTRKGTVHIAELAKFYKANQHPKVRSGELGEDAVTSNFLSAFTGGATADCVTFAEFEEYYEGISVGVPDDEQFGNILRNAWSI